MPKEVSDIKSFIEICRRKDASCTYFPRSAALYTRDDIDGTEDIGQGTADCWGNMECISADILFLYSCAHQEEPCFGPDQVQGPLQELPLHPRP